MNFIKKAFHFGQAKEGEAPKEWESEPDPYKKDIMRLTDFCENADCENNYQQVIEALTEIGNIAYIGGIEIVKCVLSELMAFLLNLIQDASKPAPLRTQALRTISMVAHRNRAIQEHVYKQPDALEAILDIISNVTRVQESRWGCYALLMLINDNVNGLKLVKEMESTEESLGRAADIDLPWFMWGSNHADVLLKHLGLREYNQTFLPNRNRQPFGRSSRKYTMGDLPVYEPPTKLQKFLSIIKLRPLDDD